MILIKLKIRKPKRAFSTLILESSKENSKPIKCGHWRMNDLIQNISVNNKKVKN